MSTAADLLHDLAQACRRRPLDEPAKATVQLLMCALGVGSIRVDELIFECPKGALSICEVRP